jgi:dUTPase
MRVRVFDRLNRISLPFVRAKEGDVGHDLFSVILPMNMTWFERLLWKFRKCPPFYILWPNQIKAVNSGLHLDMPPSLWCECKARSSIARRKLAVIGGIIDSGYNGEMFTVLHNLGHRPRFIYDGERYSQVIFHKAYRPEMRPIDETEFLELVASSERGMTGFGSTGR